MMPFSLILRLQLRKVTPIFENLVRVDDTGLTPPPGTGVERWGDMKIDMDGSLPIVNLSVTPQAQAVNTAIIDGESYHRTKCNTIILII